MVNEAFHSMNNAYLNTLSQLIKKQEIAQLGTEFVLQSVLIICTQGYINAANECLMRTVFIFLRKKSKNSKIVYFFKSTSYIKVHFEFI